MGFGATLSPLNQSTWDITGAQHLLWTLSSLYPSTPSVCHISKQAQRNVSFFVGAVKCGRNDCSYLLPSALHSTLEKNIHKKIHVSKQSTINWPKYSYPNQYFCSTFSFCWKNWLCAPDPVWNSILITKQSNSGKKTWGLVWSLFTLYIYVLLSWCNYIFHLKLVHKNVNDIDDTFIQILFKKSSIAKLS